MGPCTTIVQDEESEEEEELGALFGPPVPFSIHGDTRMNGTRIPARVKSNGGEVDTRPSGLGMLAGVGKWS